MIDRNCAGAFPVLCQARPALPRVDSSFPAFSVAAATEYAATMERRIWIPLAGWSTETEYPGLINGFEMDMATGRFTAHYEGIYVASASARLDLADTGWFAMGVITNDNLNHIYNSGCVVMSGHNPPPDHVSQYEGDQRGVANNHFDLVSPEFLLCANHSASQNWSIAIFQEPVAVGRPAWWRWTSVTTARPMCTPMLTRSSWSPRTAVASPCLCLTPATGRWPRPTHAAATISTSTNQTQTRRSTGMPPLDTPHCSPARTWTPRPAGSPLLKLGYTWSQPPSGWTERTLVIS